MGYSDEVEQMITGIIASRVDMYRDEHPGQEMDEDEVCDYLWAKVRRTYGSEADDMEDRLSGACDRELRARFG